MKIKNLRKMVSVILCAVISCMCLVSPVSAEEGDEPIAHTIGDYGVIQLQMYPIVYDDSTDKIISSFTPSSTQYYSGGAGSSLINLNVDSMTKMIYRENNCNAWVLRLKYSADKYTRSIKFYFALNDISTEYTIRTTSSGYEDILIPGNATHISYTLYTTFTDGTVFQSPGHINI